MGHALRKLAGRPTPSSSSVKGSNFPHSQSPSESRFQDPRFRGHLPGDVHPGPPPFASTDDREWDRSDPMYSAMVKELAGSVVSKPSETVRTNEGMLFRRPLPRNRSGTGSGLDESSPVPPGRLNVTQIRQIFLSYQGLIEGEGSKDVKALADKYNVDASVLEKVLKFSSIPSPDGRHEFKAVPQENTIPKLHPKN